MATKIKKKCVVCGKEFITFPRFKACSPECIAEYKKMRSRASSKKRYTENPEKWKEKVHKRYLKKKEDILAYARQYRKDHKEEIAAKDRIRKKISRTQAPPYSREKTCPACRKTFISYSAPQIYCSNKCQHSVANKRHAVWQKENKDYRSNYIKNYKSKKRHDIAIQIQNSIKESFSDVKYTVLKNPMEFASIQVERLSEKECRCLNCGQTYILLCKKSARSFLMYRLAAGKNPCPYCGEMPLGFRSGSLVENELKKMYNNFTDLNVKPKWMYGLELNLYDPVNKIAIEFCGTRWHSERYKLDNYGHSKKTDYADKHGVHLIQIWETEWRQRKECVIDKLDKITNKPMKHIDAKTLTAKIMSPIKEKNIVNDFMNTNHIQGMSNWDWAVCLLSDNEIYAACTFKYGHVPSSEKDIKKANKSWELNRYATKLHTYVNEGLSECIKKFIKTHASVNRLIHFADRRWEAKRNSIYANAGFIDTGIIEPDYMYTDLNSKHALIDKQTMKKTNIKKFHPEIYDKSLTEVQLAKKLKLYRIFDAGMIRYEYLINQKG